MIRFKIAENNLSFIFKELEPIKDWRTEAHKLTQKMKEDVKVLMKERELAENDLVNSILGSSYDTKP